VKRILPFIGAAVALFAAGPVFAEPPIGTRLGDRVRRDPVKDQQEAARGAHELASCLVNKYPRNVRALLATTSADQSQKAAKRLHGEVDCFSMSDRNHLVEGVLVSFPPDVFRGMLAEYLLKKDAAQVRQLPLLQPLQQIYVRPWYPATARDPIVDEMATCVAEVNPAGTFAMLGTKAYSPAEGTAIAALSADFGRCLRAGAKLRANRQALRAALAEALYQRTQSWPIAQPQPTGATK
jgi:hypothetical protein